MPNDNKTALTFVDLDDMPQMVIRDEDKADAFTRYLGITDASGKEFWQEQPEFDEHVSLGKDLIECLMDGGEVTIWSCWIEGIPTPEQARNSVDGLKDEDGGDE